MESYTRTWKWFQSLTEEQREIVRAMEHLFDEDTMTFTFGSALPESFPDEPESEVDTETEDLNKAKEADANS